MTKPDKLTLPLSRDLLERLARFQEVELQDVEMDLGEVELDIGQSQGGANPALLSRMAFEFALIRDSASRMAQLLGGGFPAGYAPLQAMAPQALAPQPAAPARPTALIPAKVTIPKGDYVGSVVEVKLGATKAEGGTRSASYVIGGERAPAFYNFQSPPPHKPIIALDVFDWPEVRLSKAVKMHFEEVLHDTGEWARVCVEKYGAEMVNLHLLTIDPLIDNAPPSAAVKKVEEVLQAVDVPISIGGCGDPKKDLEVFTAISEKIEGERLLINSVTLDMDIEKSARLIKDHDNCVIAFTSMDVNKARELNRKLYDFVPKEQIIMDTTTAALGYGLDYAFTVMERCRLAALKGDPELNHPLSSGTTNAWAARESWMKMGPEFSPRELRGPIWETITGQTMLLAGVDYFMMMHPAAVNALKTMIDGLMKGERPADPADWVTLKVGG
ncbi:CO dehydrogenase/acetyl-CoA synthase subunit delta [Candidatus Bathyarchaeota archaeon RBG_13_60_20]|nr:MAG: CO dehydrogenase/acetyl-CoA synthase subunit delta [Candidatus Bathyarchaeota archaeon RBG_13_60_20]